MSYAKVLSALKRHESFLITTHVNPDIDGLSSELAMALFLKKQGKKVTVVNTEEVLPMHAFLPGAHLVRKFNRQPVSFDCAIIVDCGDLNRVDRVRKLMTKGKPVINIDHHVTNDKFGDVNLVDYSASSTAEMVFHLLKKGKCKLTKDMAVLLYLGIMTDTGSFRFDNTTARTHSVVAELMTHKFSVAQFYKKVYETVPLADLKNFVKLMNGFQMTHHGRVATVELTKPLLKTVSKEFDIREKIFSLLRAIKGVEVIVIFTEHEHRATRINFRSQGNVDVAKLASQFKGGGHKRASGCWVQGKVKEAKRKIFAQLSKVLR